MYMSVFQIVIYQEEIRTLRYDTLGIKPLGMIMEDYNEHSQYHNERHQITETLYDIAH